MTLRDDFSQTLKQTIFSRAGGRCSNPGCRAQTNGPRAGSDKAFTIGVAAHISAAASGGPRVDPSQSSAERAGQENAIWLCQNCGSRVDGDRTRYPRETLLHWKREAEKTAELEAGKPLILSASTDTAVARQIPKELSRVLSLKRRMMKDLLGGRPPHPAARAKNPVDDFVCNNLIIRSIDGKSYPNVLEEGPGISSWFKTEPFDFYHNGLQIIVGCQHGVTDRTGRWALLRDGQAFDKAKYQQFTAFRLAHIPFSRIIEYDMKGDEYYPFPHIYCRYIDGTPYEGYSYVMLDDPYRHHLDEVREFRLSDVVG